MKKNVLIFPCGSISALNIYEALRYNVNFNVFGATSRSDHSEYVYEEGHLIKEDLMITNPLFIDKLNSIIEQYYINFIIPTHDVIARYLMEQQSNIRAIIVCSPLETCIIAEDKYKTYLKLKDKFYYPEVYDYNELQKEKFPIFIKPRIGAGGKGTKLINSFEEFKKEKIILDDVILCEYLPGDEYTIDCFTDRKGILKYVGARTRERITSGVAWRSRTTNLDIKILEIATDLNKTLKFRGPWFFQLKKDKNSQYKLLEFSVRQAGTSALYRQNGINFPLLSLFDFMNLDVYIIDNKLDITLDRGIKTCYKIQFEYDTVFVDFDDTLIVNGLINTKLMRLLYQFVNKNKKIILITKHINDINESFEKYKISVNLFVQILVLKDDEHKYEFIKNDKAIFIDNWFKERYDVYQKCRIPVFDVDMIESLIDESMI